MGRIFFIYVGAILNVRRTIFKANRSTLSQLFSEKGQLPHIVVGLYFLGITKVVLMAVSTQSSIF
jgi:hypothetical protein